MLGWKGITQFELHRKYKRDLKFQKNQVKAVMKTNGQKYISSSRLCAVYAMYECFEMRVGIQVKQW